VGNALVLIPQEDPWETLFDSLEQFEPGFRMEREQPSGQQKRARLKP
jgi:antitoxin VapB